ncbi:MAG: hypothetical protein NT022_02250 [Deltaproteobacteria bacterium]|nr:hypothetical protein [Deltaproteobacteria bacterium]
MNPLSMYDQFEQKVCASTGKVTKSWSSLKPVFDVLEAQLKQAVQRRDVKQLSLKPLTAAIATAERDRQQRAVKYKGAIEWLRARWGADNGHAGALRAMIEIEQKLIARVNEALVKRRTVDVNTIADLSLVGLPSAILSRLRRQTEMLSVKTLSPYHLPTNHRRGSLIL